MSFLLCFILEWRIFCYSRTVFWRRSVTPRRIATITRVVSVNTWTSTSTSKATPSEATSTTTCSRRSVSNLVTCTVSPTYNEKTLQRLTRCERNCSLPSANEVSGKVMFSQASVILAKGGGLHPRGFCIQGVSASRGTCIQGLGRPPLHGALRNTFNKWAVCILLECILVVRGFSL